jgi:hypothetical protein
MHNTIKSDKPGKSSTNNFIVICILFQIAAIIGCAHLLHSSNEKYNKLVEVESSNFDTFQKWTSTSNQNFIRLFEVLETSDNRQVDSLYSTWLMINQDIDNYISNLRMSSSLNIQDDTFFQRMIESRMSYFKNVENFINNKKTGVKEAGNYFFKDLKPSFIVFQDNLGDFVQYYQEHINQNNNALFQSAKTSLWGVVIVGLLPIVCLILILIISFIYLLWLMNKLDFVNDSMA